MNEVLTITKETETEIIGVTGIRANEEITGKYLIAATASNPVTGKNKPELNKFDLTTLDTIRENILKNSALGTALDVGQWEPFNDMLALENTTTNLNRSFFDQENLAIKTYQSDIFNNWVKTEWINTVNGMASIDVSMGELNLDVLNMAQKVYNILYRVSTGGGSYYDWISAVYDQEGYQTAETPLYMGGLSKA